MEHAAQLPSLTEVPARTPERTPADDCVHCGFCLPTCPTYVSWGEEMDSPRGRIDLFRAVSDGRIELGEEVKTHFDRCLGCMACLTSCPSGVRYDHVIDRARVLVASGEYDTSNAGPRNGAQTHGTGRGARHQFASRPARRREVVAATHALRQHDGQHLGVRGGAPLGHHHVHARRDETVRFGVEDGGGEGSAGASLHVLLRQANHEIHALLQRREALVRGRESDCNPVGQRERNTELRHGHLR